MGTYFHLLFSFFNFIVVLCCGVCALIETIQKSAQQIFVCSSCSITSANESPQHLASAAGVFCVLLVVILFVFAEVV